MNKHDEKHIRKHIGMVIRTKRKTMNMTVLGLAELLNISPGFLGLIESGKRGTSLSNLIKISSLLSCPINELINIDQLGLVESTNEPHIQRLIAYLHSQNMDQEMDVDFLIDVMKTMSIYQKSKAVAANG